MRSLNKNRIDRFGRKQGHWEHYYHNGQLNFKGLYENDLRDGIWEYYYSNGKLVLKELYENGDLIKEL
jgi:antitoxin component YwqK of YwqJK toxin-antitoxin module